ncbi:MAG: hypothetical protein MPJ78_12705 [Hyphomicrobiaceae bacterium]|nr:hypothetical protein [Hyphomicrobiaceae bacterium]
MLKTRNQFGPPVLPALIAAIACLFADMGTPRAQAPQLPQMMQLQQVTLTKAQVEGFLKSMPEFDRLGKKYDKGNTSNASPMDAASRLGQFQAARAEMQKVLTANGFASYPEWIRVAQTVALTYSFIRSGDSPQQLAPQAQKALDEIDKNPNMSAEQKAQIKAMMQQQMAMARSLQPKPENVALVKSMLPQISAVMDGQ